MDREPGKILEIKGKQWDAAGSCLDHPQVEPSSREVHLSLLTTWRGQVYKPPVTLYLNSGPNYHFSKISARHSYFVLDLWHLLL